MIRTVRDLPIDLQPTARRLLAALALAAVPSLGLLLLLLRRLFLEQ